MLIRLFMRMSGEWNSLPAPFPSEYHLGIFKSTINLWLRANIIDVIVAFQQEVEVKRMYNIKTTYG